MPKTKADLVQQLVELYKQLGELATPITWRTLPYEQLEKLLREAEQRAKRCGENTKQHDHDEQWFAAGGTRN